MGGLSFRYSSSGFFGQGCQKSLGNAEKGRFNRAELSSYRPFHHRYTKIPVRSSRTSENIEEKCRFFMAGFESPKRAGNYSVCFLWEFLGLGAVFPKAPKTSQKKRFHELKPRVLEEAPKRVNCIFKQFTKNYKIERIPLNGLSRVAKPLKRLRVLIGM